MSNKKKGETEAQRLAQKRILKAIFKHSNIQLCKKDWEDWITEHRKEDFYLKMKPPKGLLQRNLPNLTEISKGVISKDGVKPLKNKNWIERKLVRIKEYDEEYTGKTKIGYFIWLNHSIETIREIADTFPDLVPDLRYSNYFLDMLPLLVEYANETAISGRSRKNVDYSLDEFEKMRLFLSLPYYERLLQFILDRMAVYEPAHTWFNHTKGDKRDTPAADWLEVFYLIIALTQQERSIYGKNNFEGCPPSFVLAHAERCFDTFPEFKSKRMGFEYATNHAIESRYPHIRSIALLDEIRNDPNETYMASRFQETLDTMFFEVDWPADWLLKDEPALR